MIIVEYIAEMPSEEWFFKKGEELPIENGEGEIISRDEACLVSTAGFFLLYQDKRKKNYTLILLKSFFHSLVLSATVLII
ncbi:MAG: hypothetical protein QM528_07625 [Phycisphaerales bacterium]|nr:hypothetical protein [Phycisphaerales bacterium]